jgi:hypothetical protein
MIKKLKRSQGPKSCRAIEKEKKKMKKRKLN